METTDNLIVSKVKISLYPNPTSECFQIGGIEGTVKLTISDLHCRTMLTKDIICDEEISLKTIPRGIYIAKLVLSNGTIEKRKLEKK